MKNKLVAGMIAGIYLLALSIEVKASDKAENSTKNSTIITSGSEIVDYPTVSYPETDDFAIEKEKATYHLSWQVVMRESLSYTEIQSSSDGVNFTTVGFIVNDANNKGASFDYFVPSDKNSINSFRLIQYGINAQKHISEVLYIK
ncbi:MAG TPA: hypothetical protein VK766_06945 [Cytophagaceae bacterium]|jgi:hypothetical protein|nr:hypothetical protein [Cytophagaceae bacterium]